MKSTISHVLVLPDIRSAQNVGSLFRTADAAGIAKIYLTGITPTPLDMFGRPNTLVTKTSLGAEQSVLWEYKKTLVPLLKKLKDQGYTVIAIEQSDRAIDYKKVKVVGPVAFVLGNEVEGISKKILEKMDVVAEIPMKGKKESLNVSVAGGIAMFRILNI